MQGFVDFLQAFLDLGATVILPVAIFLLGLFFGQKPGKAFRSGLTLGVAFVGIFLVIDLLVDNLGPAAQGMVEQLGVRVTVIDVGWPATSSIAWASVVAAFIIPLGLIVNVVMLLTKTTKTMNVDRKSTRLNSSHVASSYAVFCLKKKSDSGPISRLQCQNLTISGAFS